MTNKSGAIRAILIALSTLLLNFMSIPAYGIGWSFGGGYSGPSRENNEERDPKIPLAQGSWRRSSNLSASKAIASLVNRELKDDLSPLVTELWDLLLDSNYTHLNVAKVVGSDIAALDAGYADSAVFSNYLVVLRTVPDILGLESTVLAFIRARLEINDDNKSRVSLLNIIDVKKCADLLK